MSSLDPRYVEAVAEHMRAAREPGLDLISDADDLSLSPDGRLVAFTALVFEAVDRDAVRRVRVLDMETGEVTAVASACGQTYAPQWSPHGDRLAWVGSGGGRALIEVVGWPLTPAASVVVPGSVEYVRWSPDGGQMLLGVAEDGAEQSDVLGSGRLPSEGEGETWTPLVSSGVPDTGWRRAWVVTADGTSARQVTPAGVNVWQAAWAGEDTLVCVCSPDPSESGWYDSRLVLVDVATSSCTDVALPPGQLGVPGASPSGDRLSVLVGFMSDRCLYSGDVVVIDRTSGTLTWIDAGGMDVTDVSWCGEEALLLAGLAGTETVLVRRTLVGSQDAVVVEVWRSADATCGSLIPTCAGTPWRVVAVTHGYGQAPAITLFEPGVSPRVMLDLRHDGSDYVAEVGGTAQTVRWQTSDGMEIEGFLVMPSGASSSEGPYPLVVHVHGGPVWAWRNEWSMRYPYTPLLAARGYAVLHANSRGSTGRGQAFIAAGVTDMAAADATDLTAGVDALVARGLVDPTRVAVMGNSYGGFMAAWLIATSDAFAAAVARSPVTDWVSQHYASNIPGFDAAAFTCDPLTSDSLYRTRSPLYRAAAVKTPALLIAGARDLATPPEQAAMFHRALIEHGVDSTLVVYPEEGHGIRHHVAQVDHLARILTFFERFLPIGPAGPTE